MNASTAYTNVIHRAVKGIHALKFTRPSTEPSARIGVIAANTNWKYASDDSGNLNAGPALPINGMFAWPCSCVWPRMFPGLPTNVDSRLVPCPIGWPNPILKAHRTHTMRTIAKVAKVSIMLLIDQRFCITPPYRTTSPGTLIRPTSVAAVSCHALSPGLSQVGLGVSIVLLVGGSCDRPPRAAAGP